jgi:protein TonB
MSLLISSQYGGKDSIAGRYCQPEERQELNPPWLTTPLLTAILFSLFVHGLAVFAALHLVPTRQFTEFRTLSVFTTSFTNLQPRENVSEAPPEAIIAEKHRSVSTESVFSSAPVASEPDIGELDNAFPPTHVERTAPATQPPARPLAKKLVSSRSKTVVPPEIKETLSPTIALPTADNAGSTKIVAASLPVSQQTIAETQENKPANLPEPPEPGNAITPTQRFTHEHLDKIGAKVMAALQYPAMAKRMKWQGQTYIGFILHPSGEVTDVVVEKSSGFPLLDKQAIAAVTAAAPFTGPSAKFTITLPIRFHLD